MIYILIALVLCRVDMFINLVFLIYEEFALPATSDS